MQIRIIKSFAHTGFAPFAVGEVIKDAPADLAKTWIAIGVAVEIKPTPATATEPEAPPPVKETATKKTRTETRG